MDDLEAIDEFLAVSLPYGRRNAARLKGTVHLHCTDGEGEWFIDTDGTVERKHQKADVALRGSASDLLLALQGRVDIDDLEVFGDAAIVRELIESLDLS
jgi:predicted lipid carrier protein YhbT